MGIKLIDPKATIKIVSLYDSAIDKVATDIKAYADGYDTSLLKFLEGEVPTYFEISNIGSDYLVEIQQEHYVTEMPKMLPGQTMDDLKNQKMKVTPVRQGEMLVKYFRAGCKKFIDGNVETIITDEIIKAIPAGTLQEIGSFIMSRSLLPESKKK